MRNRVEYILGGMTILQGLLVGMEWKEMGISAVDIIFTFAGNGSYSSFSEKEISKKVLPEMWN